MNIKFESPAPRPVLIPHTHTHENIYVAYHNQMNVANSKTCTHGTRSPLCGILLFSQLLRFNLPHRTTHYMQPMKPNYKPIVCFMFVYQFDKYYTLTIGAGLGVGLCVFDAEQQFICGVIRACRNRLV